MTASPIKGTETTVRHIQAIIDALSREYPQNDGRKGERFHLNNEWPTDVFFADQWTV